MQPNRIFSTAVLIIGTAVFTLSAAGAAQAEGGISELQADLSHQLAVAGPADGAYVYDMTAKQQLFSERASATRPPASVEKLFTATTALERLGPAARLPTGVLGIGHMAPGGVWEGSLYLRGGGDPTFGSASYIRSHYGGAGASVQALAGQLVRGRGIHHVTGSIVGDETYFDALRGEPSSGFAPDPFLEGTLSALAFNRGSSGSERGPHAPAAFAAKALWRALEADGVSIRGGAVAAPTPAGAVPLAQVASPPLAQLLGLMLPSSDNFFAETLLKDLGARFAGAGTTSAGAAVVRSTMSTVFGLHPTVLDGSGLSGGDRTSPFEVGKLLVAFAATPLAPVLRSHMAVAGHTGTLTHRMRNTGASGRCQGKTGTLTGVSNLVGYCRTANEHTVAFAIFTDGISIEAAHTVQDHIAISIADATLP